MKKMLGVCFTVILCLAFAACSRPSKIDKAEIDCGVSEKFRQAEIKAAMDVAMERFKEFEDCDLVRLYYDEKASDKEVLRTNENAIMILSDFTTGPTAGNDGFNENSFYPKWKWVLERDSKDGAWRIVTYGYC